MMRLASAAWWAVDRKSLRDAIRREHGHEDAAEENQLVLRKRQLIALLLALIVGLFLFEPWSLFSKPIWEQAPSSESVAKGDQIFAAN